MRADFVLPTLSIGIIVSSVATTCDCRTRSAINSYKGSTKSATSPHQIDFVARETSKPWRSKMFSSRYKGVWARVISSLRGEKTVYHDAAFAVKRKF
jgi:hypothetical protein